MPSNKAMRISINLPVGFIIVSCIFCFYFPVGAQDFLEELFSGKIISNEPGVWAIYEITDKTSRNRIFLRQAITGIETIDNKTEAIWLESEIIPVAGFPSVYRFLISYDTGGKEKIHKIVVRDGAELPKEIDVKTISEFNSSSGTFTKKKLIGNEEIEYKNGKINTKHYKIEDESMDKDIWISEEVKPLGIVKLVTKEGEMILVRFGKGGNESKSSIESQKGVNHLQQNQKDTHVEVSIDANNQKRPVVEKKK